MKPFPTIWYRGNTAMFHVGKHLVCVPLKFGSRVKFGSSDRADHFVPLLYRLWQEHPFSVRKGVLVQRYTKQIDGVRKEVEENVAHRLFAAYAHQDIGFEWTEVTAKNGNFLCLTRENIVPVRDPNATATDNEKEHEAQRQMTEHQFTGSFPFMMRFFAKFLRAQERSDVITTEQLTELQTASVKTLLEAERALAADLTRDDVEFQNLFERQVFLMTRPDLVIVERPSDHPDGVAHPRPVRPTKSIGHFDENGEGGRFGSNHDPHDGKELSMGRRASTVQGMVNAAVAAEIAQHKIRNVRMGNDYHAATEATRNRKAVPAYGYEPCKDYAPKTRPESYRADLQGHWNDPSTEAVLNRHGWVTPANGGKPRYAGKGFNGGGEQVSRLRGNKRD